MTKISYFKLILFLCFSIFVSCTQQNSGVKIANQTNIDKESQSLRKNKVLKKENSNIIVAKFIDIPKEMIGSGCGISFYRTEKEYTEQEYIWVDNITNGVIKINGKMEKLSAIIENGKVTSIFRNSRYIVTYRVISSDPISDESAKLKGILKIKSIENNDSIIINAIGLSDC
ncbi:MAG: hypothetical protein PHT07_06280 [Paludibacter sp.]|nr:hypothetical protein [Paludibacter sp.]